MIEEIPAGYMKDAKDRLIPIAQVKEIDQTRDELVKGIASRAMEVAQLVAEFKKWAHGEIAAFVATSAQDYGVELGGEKGNVTLISFDGRFKLIRAKADNLVFTEQLQAAKKLVDQCITKWTEGSRTELKAVVNKAFEVNKSGEISTSRVLGLRSLDIDDPDWAKAMQAITDSIQVTGTKTYLRVYRRAGSADEYVQIALDGGTALEA